MNPPSPRRARVAATFLALAAISATTLSACSADDGDGVTLRFNWWGEDTRHALTQEIVAAFEKEHPEIDVQVEYSSWDDYWDKLSTSAAAQDLPDVMQVTDPYMFQYIDSGQLLDLHDVEDAIDLSVYPEESLSLTTSDDGLYAVPAAISSFAVPVVTEHFEAAGVPLPDDQNWTWDDYIAAAVAVHEANPEVYGSTLPVYSNQAGVWLRQHGEDWWSADGSKLNFKPETLAAYWEWVVKLRDSGATPSVEETLENIGGIEQSLLVTGEAAMAPEMPINQLEVLESTGGRDASLMLFPGDGTAAEPGGWTKPGIFYAVYAGSEHPEEAAMLIDYLNSEPSFAIQKFDRGVPANPEVVSAIEAELTPAESEQAQFIERVNALGPKPVPKANPNAGSGLVDLFARLNEDVLFDRITPAQAGQQMYDELSADL
jgi:multiple sugar transport system substrate-binding protein